MDRRSFLTGIVTLAGSVSEVGGYQSARAPRIGYLSAATGRIPIDDAFDAALKTLGYIEGQNITLHRRYLGDRTDNAGSAANELVALNPDVIVVWSPPLTSAVKATAPVFLWCFSPGAPRWNWVSWGVSPGPVGT